MVRKIAALAIVSGLFGLLAFPLAPQAAQESAPELTFRNGRFEPASLNVAANQPVKLKVVNAGDCAVEFESFELNRERVVPPGRSVTVILPRLDPGEYHFFDDFHHDAGQGTITAR